MMSMLFFPPCLTPRTKQSSQEESHCFAWSPYPSMSSEPLAQRLVSRRTQKTLVEWTDVIVYLSRWSSGKGAPDGAWPSLRREQWKDRNRNQSWRRQWGQRGRRVKRGGKEWRALERWSEDDKGRIKMQQWRMRSLMSFFQKLPLWASIS